MTKMQVAQTIINQMGGVGKLRAMIGAYDMIAGPNRVRFSFKGSRKFNLCQIELDPMDTYKFNLYRLSPSKMSVTAEHETTGLYCDQLIPWFERETGLYLSL